MADNQNTVYLSTPSGHGNQSAASTALSDLSLGGIDAATLDLSSTLSVGGAAKISAISATAGQFSSTLSVGGAARISALSATAGQFSSTMSVAGVTKAASISCAGVTSSSIITCASTTPLSLLTHANAASMTIGQLRLVFASSGISLIYSSGASYYIVGGSATSAAQA